MDTRKSCLLHDCDPENCGCVDAVSQANYKLVTRITSGIPSIMILGGLPAGMDTEMKGPFRMVERMTRQPYFHMGQQFEKVVSEIILFEKV